ncbi:MAG: HlyD family efflux transporter periplasmic adaptor subunit [Dysgonamonadaceae bacterium]|jgi:HlyD family secretion protein|nr:HlyD family efflux transporter periplasmic adaptor subunit [Dysgonamonadaceae bacterium]
MKTIKMTVLCASIILLVACGKKKGDYDASGSFEATEVLVSAQATGQIMAFNLTEGQSLLANDETGYIDTTQLHLKKAQLMASMRAVDSHSYNVARQIASLKQQIVKQETELARFQKLLQSNAATQKQVDDIQSAIAILQRQSDAQTESLQNNNSSISAELSGLHAQLEQIDDLIQKSVISSPISGTVLSKYAEKGETAAQGKALFKIADLDNMHLRAYITADQLDRMKLNQEVIVRADFGEKNMREYTGKITWISGKAEFTPRTILTKNERANQVYAVKIAVKNDGYLKIGMYGEIKSVVEK